jgi:hypothetical protein
MYKDVGRPVKAAFHLDQAMKITARLVEAQADQMAWQDTYFHSRLESLELQPLTPGERLAAIERLGEQAGRVYAGVKEGVRTQRFWIQLRQLKAQQLAALHRAEQEVQELRELEAQLAQISVKRMDLFEIGWRQAIVRLRLAALAQASGRGGEARALCQQVKSGVLPKLVRQSSHWTAVWVRASECLGESAQVAQDAAWLKSLAEKQTARLLTRESP